MFSEGVGESGQQQQIENLDPFAEGRRRVLEKRADYLSASIAGQGEDVIDTKYNALSGKLRMLRKCSANQCSMNYKKAK